MSAVLEVTPRKELSILIVQTGEIEEVFRSLMAVKAVKHLYPEMKLHFIVRSGHSAPLHRLDWVSHILEIPKLDPENGMKGIAEWVDQVIAHRYDLLVNWTFSQRHMRMSAIVTTLIPAAVKFGNYMRNDFTVASFDAWSIYREAWLRDVSIDQDIHHTDIITTQLLTALQVHAGEPLSESSGTVVTSKHFFNIPKQNFLTSVNSKWIAIHPDSLDSRYDEVIEMILRRHPDCGVVLLNDTPIADGDQSFAGNPRVVDLSGKLNFDSLAAVLADCSWLIAGRAPIVELANLLNIRTIYWIEAQPAITGEAKNKWTETGPYGNGSIAIRFTGEFQPEAVYAVWSHFQSEWFHRGKVSIEEHFGNLGLVSKLGEMEIYKSRIRVPQEGGGVFYDSVIVGETTFGDWMFRLRGQMARSWFCGWVPPIDDEVAKLKLSPELIKRVREVRESMRVIEQLSSEGKTTSKDLKTMVESVKNINIMPAEDRVAIEDMGRKLVDLEGLLERVVKVEPELKGLFTWYRYLMHNLNGKTLDQMALETLQAFDLLAEAVELIQVYVNKVLDQARPKSVGVLKEVTPLQEK